MTRTRFASPNGLDDARLLDGADLVRAHARGVRPAPGSRAWSPTRVPHGRVPDGRPAHRPEPQRAAVAVPRRDRREDRVHEPPRVLPRRRGAARGRATGRGGPRRAGRAVLGRRDAVELRVRRVRAPDARCGRASPSATWRSAAGASRSSAGGRVRGLIPAAATVRARRGASIPRCLPAGAAGRRSARSGSGRGGRSGRGAARGAGVARPAAARTRVRGGPAARGEPSSTRAAGSWTRCSGSLERPATIGGGVGGRQRRVRARGHPPADRGAWPHHHRGLRGARARPDLGPQGRLGVPRRPDAVPSRSRWRSTTCPSRGTGAPPSPWDACGS